LTKRLYGSAKQFTLERTPEEHLKFLERRISALSARIQMAISTEEERNRLQAEILIAERRLHITRGGTN
jgi:hypothetical protein